MNRASDHNEPAFAPDYEGHMTSKELVHNLLRLLRIAHDRRKTLLQSLCAALSIGAIYYALAPRFYESSAKLLIVQRSKDQLPTVDAQAGSDNIMATHKELVTSAIVVQSAIERLLPEHSVDFENSPPQEWNKRLADNLSASTTRRTNIIEVRYRSLNPEAAATIVSAVIQSYLQFVERTHHGSATEVIRVLTTERHQLQQDLATKQLELQSFRQRKGQLAIRAESNVVDPMIQRALRLNDALMSAQEERLELQATLASVEAAVRNSANLSEHLAAIEKVLGKEILASALGLSPQDQLTIHEQERELLKTKTELQAIAPYYGPAHPRTADLTNRARNIENYLAQSRGNGDQRIASLNSALLGPTLVMMLQQELAAARHKEQQLLDSFHAARAEAAQHSGDIVQLEMLEREVERLENLHDILFDKIATVDIDQLQGPIQATVVQEPLPDDMPVSPQLRMVVISSVLGALILGGLVAYVQDILDDRFTSPDDISAQLGVPLLAMVRQLELLDGEGLNVVHTYLMPNSAETEAFRTLRTALMLQSDAANKIAISSAEPGDGKTTVALNLAASYAQAGHKTLIIDADLRKPGLTNRLGLKGQPGVADVLTAEANASEIAAQLVQTTELKHLNVLPAGLRLPNPAELLSSQRFAELLAWAEAHYDQILVDCPPVLAVSDAQIVGRLIDGAILVVRPEKNHRRLVIKACDSFFSTGSRVLGVVANGLSAHAGKGYGYGFGYGYGYGYGLAYGEESESEDSVKSAEEFSLRSKAA